MLANTKTSVATSRCIRLAYHHGTSRRVAARTVPHQDVSSPDYAQQQRASSALAAKPQRLGRRVKAPSFTRTEQTIRQSKLIEVMRGEADATEICKTEYQVVLRSQLELVVLEHRRSQLDLEVNTMASDKQYHFSTAGTTHWTALHTARKAQAELNYEILIRKLLLRNQQANPEFVSINDPALQHQASRLLAQQKKRGCCADANVECPTANISVDEAQTYLDVLDYVRLTEKIKTLRAQAAVMHSLPEFKFTTNNTSARYHLLVHNLYNLQGAQAELEVLLNKYRGDFKSGKVKTPKQAGSYVEANRETSYVRH